MWTQIDANNAAGLTRHVAIMQQMNHGYEALTPKDLVDAIAIEHGEVWHFQGAGFEIAMMLRYIAGRRQWHMAHVGFVGNVQPAEALEINILRGREFMQAHGVSSVIAVRPKVVDFQPLQQYHDLCLAHPRLKVTVLTESETNIVWDVAFVPITP